MSKKPTPPDQSTEPEEFPQTPPRDLYATSDIRFVMRETSALGERIDNLKDAVEKLTPIFEKALDRHSADLKERIADLKSDLKCTDGKVADMEKTVAFTKGVTRVLGGLFAIALVLLGVIATKLLS